MNRGNGLLIAGALAVTLLLVAIMLPLLLVASDNSAPSLSTCAIEDGADKDGVKIPEEYQDALAKAAQASGLPLGVLAAQIQAESSWNPKASSGVANGLAQFTEATWASYGNGKSVWDPLAAIDAQGRYMADLIKQVSPVASSEQNKVELALAAYNAGPKPVLDAKGIPPYPETRDYVSKIMRNAQVDYTANCAPAVENAADIQLGPGEWTNPLPGSHITSGYGARPCPLSSCVGMPFLLFHEGIDLAGGPKPYFYAPTDMQITHVGGPGDPLYGSYGNYIFAVQVDDPHLVFEFHEAADGSLRVQAGQRVKAGTPLGKPGATGNSSGVHVHFQIDRPGTDVTGATVQNGKSLDPMPFLREKGAASS